jgi:di/tricarboxylate transporter
MPVAFGSILGGMTTLIGTPPNLIVANFRTETGASGFAMFDFTPVGAAVALVGVAFIVPVGWRLVPPRKRVGSEGFERSAYLTEARVLNNAKAAGMTLGPIEKELGAADAQVVGIVHKDTRMAAPRAAWKVWAGGVFW